MQKNTNRLSINLLHFDHVFKYHVSVGPISEILIQSDLYKDASDCEFQDRICSCFPWKLRFSPRAIH